MRSAQKAWLQAEEDDKTSTPASPLLDPPTSQVEPEPEPEPQPPP